MCVCVCVSGDFFLIFIVKCAKFAIVRRMCRLVHACVRQLGGARCSRTILRIQGKKKKKIRSLRSDDVLVTPNFRENHRGRREGASSAISRVIVPYFIFSPRGPRTERQHERRFPASEQGLNTLS